MIELLAIAAAALLLTEGVEVGTALAWGFAAGGLWAFAALVRDFGG